MPWIIHFFMRPNREFFNFPCEIKNHVSAAGRWCISNQRPYIRNSSPVSLWSETILIQDFCILSASNAVRFHCKLCCSTKSKYIRKAIFERVCVGATIDSTTEKRQKSRRTQLKGSTVERYRSPARKLFSTQRKHCVALSQLLDTLKSQCATFVLLEWKHRSEVNALNFFSVYFVFRNISRAILRCLFRKEM